MSISWRIKAMVLIVVLALAMIGYGATESIQAEEINLLLNRHPFTDSMTPLIDEFEEETGITVGEVEMLPEVEYFERLVMELSGESSRYDVFMVGNPHLFQYAPAGWMEPLDDYIEESPEWNVDDFKDSFIDAVSWSTEPGDPVGTGSTWAIPVNQESHIIHMRYDLLEKYDLDIPETWEELAETIRYVDEQEEDIVGFAHRGLADWGTIHPGYMAGFSTWGAEDMDEDLNVTLNSEEGIAWTEYFMDLVLETGSEGWPATAWYDGKEQFAAGDSFAWFDADHQAETFENPEESEVVGDVAYVIPPEHPNTGEVKTNLWTWSLAMNSFSENKDAAWEFIKWASSTEILAETVPAHNVNPPRESVWNHPDVIEFTEDWGVDETPYRDVIEEVWEYAEVRWTPLPITPEIGDRWAAGLQSIFTGDKTAEEAMDDVAEDVQELLEDEF